MQIIHKNQTNIKINNNKKNPMYNGVQSTAQYSEKYSSIVHQLFHPGTGIKKTGKYSH